MKHIYIIITTMAAALAWVASADDRQTSREQRMQEWLDPNRPALLQEGIKRMKGKTAAELAAVAGDAEADRDDRIGAAVLLLREHPSDEGLGAAMAAIHLEVRPGVDEWSSASDWRLQYPVAAEMVKHPELMPALVERIVVGAVADPVSIWILVTYKLEGHDPTPLLKASLENAVSDDVKRRTENWLERLEPRRPAPVPAEAIPLDE